MTTIHDDSDVSLYALKGGIYTTQGFYYILAQVGEEQWSLVGLADGNRLSDDKDTHSLLKECERVSDRFGYKVWREVFK